MSMFEKYDNLDKDYIPDNSTKKENIIQLELDMNPVKEMYNINNQFMGYMACEDDTCNIPVKLNRDIYVDEDAIIYKNKQEGPDENTIGHKGQKAYNTVDYICWTCYDIEDDKYLWKKDNSISHLSKGKKITLSPNYEEDFKIEINIENFRHEIIKTFTFENSYNVICTINSNEENKLKQSLYNVNVIVKMENYSKLIDSYLLMITDK